MVFRTRVMQKGAERVRVASQVQYVALIARGYTEVKDVAGGLPFTPGLTASSVDAFGGDSSGARDSSAAFVAALGSLPVDPYTGYRRGEVVFGSGVYRIDRPLPNIGPNVYVRGAGLSATFVEFRGTGDCFTCYSSWFPSESYAVPMENSFMGGGVHALTVDGTRAGPGSTGIRFGDGIGQEIGTSGRVHVRNFRAPGSVGIWQNSRVSWTEKARVDAYVTSNDTGYKVSLTRGGTTTLAQAVTLPAATVTLAELTDLFPRVTPNGNPTGIRPGVLVGNQRVEFTGYTENADGTVTLTGCTGGTGTHAAGTVITYATTNKSMGYNSLRIDVGMDAGQDGVVVADGANLYGSDLTIKGNGGTAATPQTNAFLRVAGGTPVGLVNAGDGAQIYASRIDVQVEGYGDGGNGPYTIVCDDTPWCRIAECVGLAYWGGEYRLTPSADHIDIDGRVIYLDATPELPDPSPALTIMRGVPVYTAGRFGNAVSSGVLFTDDNLTAPVGTLEAWLKSTAIGWRVAIGSNSPGGLWVGTDGGEGKVAAGFNGGGMLPNRIIADDAWHHVALTVNGSEITLWVDGTVAQTTPYAYPFELTGDGTLPFAIGGFGTDASGDWSGQVDEVRVSKVVRYTAPFTPPTGPFAVDADTIALYHLDG